MSGSDRQLHEIALTKEEVDQILNSATDSLLVGGQSLAFWANFYNIVPGGVLAQHVTSDADFIGSSQAARKLADALRAKGWRFWSVEMDDATPQTAKITKEIEGQGVKQIDFLDSIVGLKTDRVSKRAIAIGLPGGAEIHVLHPLDVLASRLHNLAVLPSKRNWHGIAQAELAIAVARKHLEATLQDNDVRRLLNEIEYLATLALEKKLSHVFYEFSLEPLVAVPADRVPVEKFRELRWPQICKHVALQREAYARRQAEILERKQRRASPAA